MSDEMENLQAQKSQNGQQHAGQHVSWIAGRVQVLLSHYFQPDNPTDVVEAAIGDWIEALSPFSQPAIDNACRRYLHNQPRRRPTPGDIRAAAQAFGKNGSEAKNGAKAELTRDDLHILETKILPTARRWLGIPDLADHGRKTLEYWGEFEHKSEWTLNPENLTAGRIKRGEAVGDNYIFGRTAVDLIKANLITENDLKPYRSAMFFQDKDVSGEEVARQREHSRRVKHDAACESAGVPQHFKTFQVEAAG